MTIHWPTLLFQAVNFLVLLALLTRLMFKPLLRHMRERREGIENALSDIETTRTELAAEREKLADADARAATMRAEVLAEARRSAEGERQKILEAARAEADEERARRLAQVEVERERGRRELVDSLGPLVARTTERILAELTPATPLHTAACAKLAEHLSSLGPTDGPLDVESANGELTPELEAAIAAVAEQGRARSVETRPSLIAGARIRIGDVVHDGSVEGQIHRALEGVS